MESKKTFLVHFLKKWKYLDFCLGELEALAEMNGVKKEELYANNIDTTKIDLKMAPYVYINLPSVDIAQKIQERSVLIN